MKQTWNIHEALIKRAWWNQAWSKLGAHVVHVYFEYICFMFASSRKRGITAGAVGASQDRRAAVRCESSEQISGAT